MRKKIILARLLVTMVAVLMSYCADRTVARARSESWQETPEPTTSKIRIITTLPAQTIRLRIVQELRRQGFALEQSLNTPGYGDGNLVIGPNGSLTQKEPEINSYKTRPKDISDPPRTRIRLSVYLTADTIINISGEAGKAQWNPNNPNEPYVDWEDITYGTGDFGPFSWLKGVANRFPEGKTLYNKFQ